MNNEYLTIADAAKCLGATRAQIRESIEDHNLNTINVRRQLLIPLSEIEIIWCLGLQLPVDTWHFVDTSEERFRQFLAFFDIDIRSADGKIVSPSVETVDSSISAK